MRFAPSGLRLLVEWCDVLVVAVRAGRDTRHIIDASMLQRLGRDGIVINISRGSVIDQAALLKALQPVARMERSEIRELRR